MSVRIISTVLVAASATAPAGAYDLTDLATVKDELSILPGDTSQDAFLQRAITQASMAIANYCSRVFPVEALQDLIYIQQDPYPYQVPGGVFPLQLSRWPLVNASPVTVTGNTHGNTTVDGIADTSGLVQGELAFAADGSVPAGATISSIGAGSITLSKPASSSETGIAITAGMSVMQTQGVTLSKTLVFGSDYTIDVKLGALIRINQFTGMPEKWEAEPVTVQYQAGYAAIPADLIEATLRLVTMRVKGRGRDPMLKSEGEPGLGQQQWWIGPVPGQNGALPPEIQALVQSYRVPVTA